MRVGVTLPSFRQSAAEALQVAGRAEELGIDGVFVFDHLWPVGQRERPALGALPLLGALAASTSNVVIGPLVARLSLLPDPVFVRTLLSLARMAPGRFVAGLGTGDRRSAAESSAYGITLPPLHLRRASMRECAGTLTARGVPVWIGGGSPANAKIAAELGVGVNLWESGAGNVWALRALAALAKAGKVPEVTWAGPAGEGVDAISRRLWAVADAGGSWAVCAWPSSLEDVAVAAGRVRRGE